MVDFVTAILFIIALFASLFMAWTIGAGSAGSTPFAPAVGANAIPVMRAAFIVGILIFFGAIIQGANVSEAVGRELILDIEFSLLGASIALVIAGSLVMIGVFTGYPIATAFTVTGAVIGVGLALGGSPAWEKYLEIAGLWTLTPVAGGGVAYILSRRLQSNSGKEARFVALLGGFISLLIAHIELAPLGPDDGGASIAQTANQLSGFPGNTVLILTSLLFAVFGYLLVRRWLSNDVAAGERRFALALGAIVAFSAGGSQVGLAVGPLLPILDDIVPLFAILIGGGLGLLIGAWTGAPRLIKAVSQDYSSLGPRRSIAALIPSFAIAQISILYGIPVSFNQIIVSAIVGSGIAVSWSGAISRRKIVVTFLAWGASFLSAFFLGYIVMTTIEIIG